MKNTIILWLVMIPFLLNAQHRASKKYIDDVYESGQNEPKTGTDNTSVIPKRTWKIIVKNDHSADENFKLVGQTLVENDFEIAQKDKEFNTIKTVPRDFGRKISGVYYLNFLIREHEIIITGQGNMNINFSFGNVISNNSFSKISNIGMKGSFSKISFEKMYEFAKLLKCSNFEFITEN